MEKLCHWATRYSSRSHGHISSLVQRLWSGCACARLIQACSLERGSLSKTGPTWQNSSERHRLGEVTGQAHWRMIHFHWMIHISQSSLRSLYHLLPASSRRASILCDFRRAITWQLWLYRKEEPISKAEVHLERERESVHLLSGCSIEDCQKPAWLYWGSTWRQQ